MSVNSVKAAMNSNTRGVVKRKGRQIVIGKRLMSTRCRSKVEKIGEVMKSLRLEEKENEVLEKKMWKDTKCLRVQVHDFAQELENEHITSYSMGLPVQNGLGLQSGKSTETFKHGNREERPKVKSSSAKSKSQVKQGSDDSSEELQSCVPVLCGFTMSCSSVPCSAAFAECANLDDKVMVSYKTHTDGGPCCCGELDERVLLDEREDLAACGWCDLHQTINQCCRTTKVEDRSLKTGCKEELISKLSKEQETKTGNFEERQDHLQRLSPTPESFPCSKENVINEPASPPISRVNDMPPPSTPEEQHSSECKDHSPTSPANSPLYDMPPPSTPAQRRVRSAKRHLQLERWRKYKTTRLRQERYQRRNQQVATINKPVTSRSRHVRWSVNLVETAYFSNLIT